MRFHLFATIMATTMTEYMVAAPSSPTISTTKPPSSVPVACSIR